MSIKELLVPPLNRPPKRRPLPVFEQGDAIPRILHQTFYERTLAPELQANVDRLRALNPHWEYRFYDDADIAAFIRQHYPPLVWEYFERIDPRYGAARADLFRYLLLYKVGGVYLDIKSSAVRPFDEVLRPDDRFILSKWHLPNGDYEHKGLIYDLRHLEGGEFQQWHVICAPGHPFLKEVLDTCFANIDTYDPYLHQTGKRGVLRLTGPITYTLAICRVQDRHPHRVVDGYNQLGLRYNIYGPNLGHVPVFKGHYSTQTSSIVRLTPAKRALSRVYGLAQGVHDALLRSRKEAKAANIQPE
ncbi:glycosyltransferase family 32 protein [Massilia sp. TN1-12]|uniref:glycosyltransferase family 32 protein n=1 Tax=Massilia paldalensis TaxID=3377675 RepID=UPI00384C6CE1